jgi:sugar/nucleoside kinase (ribokinase family)
MNDLPQVLCIGSVLWDIIGRSASHMERGADVPGRITRLPGGVAMNIAMALNGLGVKTAFLSAIGQDDEGAELLRMAANMGLVTDYAYLSEDLPTDRYMAVEGANGLIAAIADAHSLEAAGDKILAPLRDGRLASDTIPWSGMVALDGNLTSEMLIDISKGNLFRAADLRIAPASPGKAERLAAFLGHGNATLYLNLEEANILTHGSHKTSEAGALALLARGLRRVLVTNGPQAACAAEVGTVITQQPPSVMVTRITGAGDVFMASHMAAELRGEAPDLALNSALSRTADYISSEKPL